MKGSNNHHKKKGPSQLAGSGSAKQALDSGTGFPPCGNGKASPSLAPQGKETAFRREERVPCGCAYTKAPKSRETGCELKFGGHTHVDHSTRLNECYRLGVKLFGAILSP